MNISARAYTTTEILNQENYLACSVRRRRVIQTRRYPVALLVKLVSRQRTQGSNLYGHILNPRLLRGVPDTSIARKVEPGS